MKNLTFLQIISKKWKFIAVFTIIIVLASVTVTLLQTPKYKASAQLLVIQENRADMDSYTAAKSAEQLATTLGKVVNTGTFIDRVLVDNKDLESNFPTTENDRKKEWEKTVDIGTTADTGFLEIDVYYENKDQAALLANSISSILAKDSSDYHGGGDKIQVKIVDTPSVSAKVAKPNLWQNTLAGLALGIIASIILVYVFYEDIPENLAQAIRPDFTKNENDNSPEFIDNNFEIEPEVTGSSQEPSAKMPKADFSKDAAPANLPIAGSAPDTTSENVTEGEKVVLPEDLSDDEKRNNWLNTGSISG